MMTDCSTFRFFLSRLCVCVCVGLHLRQTSGRVRGKASCTRVQVQRAVTRQCPATQCGLCCCVAHSDVSSHRLRIVSAVGRIQLLCCVLLASMAAPRVGLVSPSKSFECSEGGAKGAKQLLLLDDKADVTGTTLLPLLSILLNNNFEFGPFFALHDQHIQCSPAPLF